ncbi:hypothetical protein [Cohnella silvisoli]|uniref:Glycoside hydrolase family 2 n=1 Tax=Cohnella silvisoli TaxID=2873699 RepID=A0ABV1KM55_9BACL|nr:hypothetical protein [Cohnella silvisoli]MCD9020634.1 hypothetical protein [Cohnella silvisoli]
MKESLIRAEYPRPQFVRNDWLNLNGTWQFAFDDERVGERDLWHMSEEPFDRQILVPFCRYGLTDHRAGNQRFAHL